MWYIQFKSLFGMHGFPTYVCSCSPMQGILFYFLALCCNETSFFYYFIHWCVKVRMFTFCILIFTIYKLFVLALCRKLDNIDSCSRVAWFFFLEKGCWCWDKSLFLLQSSMFSVFHALSVTISWNVLWTWTKQQQVNIEVSVTLSVLETKWGRNSFF